MYIIDKQDIIDIILVNKDYFKERSKVYQSTKESAIKEEPYFADEIRVQFRDLVKSFIVDKVTRDLAIDAESVYNVLDDINLEDYLK